MPRHWIPAVLTVLMLACAGCGKSASDPPLVFPSKSATAAASASPSASASTGLHGFASSQRAAFTQAVAALQRFSATNDRFIGQGRLTQTQSAFFRKYSIRWTDDWAGLAQLVNGQIRIRGTTHEIWVRPVSIDLQAAAGQVVVIRRCLDQTDVRVFAHGKAVPQPQLKTPRMYRVTMLKRSSEQWWRTGMPKQGAKC